jgi:hypothetical protein
METEAQQPEVDERKLRARELAARINREVAQNDIQRSQERRYRECWDVASKLLRETTPEECNALWHEFLSTITPDLRAFYEQRAKLKKIPKEFIGWVYERKTGQKVA